MKNTLTGGVSLCGLQEGGRLLYIGQNEWTHVNCALWSAEVFEDDDGSLKNVHMAVLRGKRLVRNGVVFLRVPCTVLAIKPRTETRPQGTWGVRHLWTLGFKASLGWGV